MQNYCVYMHENKLNHKKYIGITCQIPEYRWGQNGQGYEYNTAFWNAIKKYGWNGFDHLILFKGLSMEEAASKEIELIAEYNTCNREYGYNISKGGIGGDSDIMIQKWKDPVFSEDMKCRMKEAWKDPNKRSKRSERARNRWTNPEFKAKVTDAIKQTCGSSVVCVETGTVYQNICDVENQLGLNHSNICRAIKTGYRCGGFHWQYYNDVSEKPND